MASIEERVEQLVKPKIEGLGYKLYDVNYIKEGANYFLRIFIEKQNGEIDLNDCEKVNNEINDILDTADYIKEQYFLEVSSTGVEKVLRKNEHLEESLEKEIEIKLFKPIEIIEKNNTKMKNNKVKEVIGILKNYNDTEIEVEVNEFNEILKINRKDISLIKTVFDWDSI